MRRLLIAGGLAVAALLTGSAVVSADRPAQIDRAGNEVAWDTSQDGCTRLQAGTLTYPPDHYLAGRPIPAGFDTYGYNYQGHVFRGSYANAYLGQDGFPAYAGNDADYLAANPRAASYWYWAYRSIRLEMRWDDAWLANVDCDGDGTLDRHLGSPSYVDSGAWLTNAMSGDDDAGPWVYFARVVAVPGSATLCDGDWCAADGSVIGSGIWGAFAIAQEVQSGSGATLLSPAAPSLRRW